MPTPILFGLRRAAGRTTLGTGPFRAYLKARYPQIGLRQFVWGPNELVGVADTLLATNPALAVADTVRSTASTLLRFTRRPWRFVTFELGPEFGYLEPGNWVWSAHELLPEPPQGYEPWRLVPLYVVEVSDPLAEAKITVKCADFRESWCSWWSPLLTEIGMTNDLNGIAMVDRSGGWETTRNQVGYGIRPPGNDSWQEVLANTPIVDAYGLRVEAGGDINHLLNSTFSEGGGDTFTSWTKTTTGAATVVGWTLYTLIDANGFRRSALCVTEAASEQSYVSQTVNGLQNKVFAVKVYYKDGGAFDRMKLRISRSDTGDYFRDSDGTWQAGVQDITLTPGSGAIDTVRYVTKSIDTTSGGTVNLTVALGHFSAATTGHQISQLQGVELIETGSANLRYYAFRSPLPTKATAVTRVENNTGIVNDSAVRVLSPTRGFVKMTVRPEWAHSDLSDGVSKYLWSSDFDGAGDAQNLRVYYNRVSSTIGRWIFRNGTPGDQAMLEVDGADLIAQEAEYVVIARWTSEAENEHGMEGQALDIWVDGVRGTPFENCPTQVASAQCDVFLGSSPNSADVYSSWDGHITHVTMDDRCPSEAELLRI